ncbi:MAG: hypothetical protein ACREBG_21875 [Pyrinomonadaceae bacterium]
MESKIHKYRSSLIAAAVCVISFAGTLASKWVATDLGPKIANYRWVAYVVAGISLVVSIVLAVRAVGESAAGAMSTRRVSIGGSANNSTNTAGDNNVINSSRNR